MHFVETLQHSSLGKSSEYSGQYNPDLLFAIPRNLARDAIKLNSEQLPFQGVDIWNGYEFSWLNAKGKPEIAVIEIHFPMDTINLIESKSLKLYLNSFYNTRFENHDSVIAQVQHDLSRASGKTVSVFLRYPHELEILKISEFNANHLDTLDIAIDQFVLDPTLLQTQTHEAEESWITHLFRSNCPITHQPDWASIFIHYQGKKIIPETLLHYLVGYREHQAFHEPCVEQIFLDILTQCQPHHLTVYGRFTRRGGLDINVFRSNFETHVENVRLFRQ